MDRQEITELADRVANTEDKDEQRAILREVAFTRADKNLLREEIVERQQRLVDARFELGSIITVD